jgi:hypothetical protein
MHTSAQYQSWAAPIRTKAAYSPEFARTALLPCSLDRVCSQFDQYKQTSRIGEVLAIPCGLAPASRVNRHRDSDVRLGDESGKGSKYSYKLNPATISTSGKCDTISPRKVLKPSSWAHHFFWHCGARKDHSHQRRKPKVRKDCPSITLRLIFIPSESPF